MKKITLLFVFLFATASVFSQSQRFILFEEFTNASCGPCASQNPAFDALLNANSTKCTSIKYHTNWPGVDPMNAQNPIDVAGRVTYYNVTGVPYAVMDGFPQTGSYYTGAPANVTQAKIDAEYIIPSPFEIQLNHHLNAAQDSIFLTMVLQATEAVSGVLVAHNVVIEKHIHFNTPPGTNGEKDFYNVMKKMLPTKDGTSLPNSFETGDYAIIQTAWKLANVYTIGELAAVGFIQNNGTKEVHQTCNSTTDQVELPYNNDLQVMEITTLPKSTCTGVIAPTVKIRNNGNNAVTSFQLKFRVNDGDVQTFSWNGNITSLQKAIISLPEYTFFPYETNILKVYSTDPNNTSDEYVKNDTLQSTLKRGPSSSNTIYLHLRTDNNPEETTWDVRNSAGQLIQTGGPYTVPNHTHFDTIYLPGDDCYIYTIYDSGGNGICCSNGNGGYELIDSEGVSIVTYAGSFGFSESTEWRMGFPTGLPSTLYDRSVHIYPNPFTGSATVSFSLEGPEQVVLSLINDMGQMVKLNNLGNLNAGIHEFTLDGNGLSPGIYFIRFKFDSTVVHRKVVITR